MSSDSRLKREALVALFGKQKGLVGVDIGSSAVKAVELKPGGQRRGVTTCVKLGLEPLPPEAIVDGAIMDSGAVIDAIQRLFSAQQDQDERGRHQRLGQRGHRQEDQPAPDDARRSWPESIHWEAEQYIPFDIQDVSLDYEVVEGGGSGGNMDVLLVAVKKDKISDYTSAHQPGRARRASVVDVGRLRPPELPTRSTTASTPGGWWRS